MGAALSSADDALALEHALLGARTVYLRDTAKQIAFAWSPVLGFERSREAANNFAMAMQDDEPLPPVIAAAAILEHRVRAFAWKLDVKTIDFLAMLAAKIWIRRERDQKGGA